MTDKVIISEYTWRSLEMQKDAYSPDLPFFVLPNDLSFLMRPTQRKEKDTFHVVSLAVIAETEKDFRNFIKQAWKNGATIKTKENHYISSPTWNMQNAVDLWKASRMSGTGKIGADIAAKNREVRTAQKIANIKDRWPLPNNEWSTPVLLDEADLSYNTAIKYLGKRPIAQYNYQAKMKRAANKVKK